MWAATVRVFADGFAEPVGETTTDRNGQFSVEVLAGAYRIRVSAPAFRAVDRLVHAVPGLEPLAVTLALEGLEESVDVVDTAGEFAIDALSSLTATTLSGDELLGLPADEEDLALYLLLLAGADSTGDLEDDVSGFIIDGFDEGRLPRPEEIAQIIIDPTPLRAAGVGEGPRIEIITRPGTGRWRRSASFDFSDESLDATTPGDRTKPARQTRNVDLDLRGPILPGRLDVDVEASTNRQQRVADSLRAITPAGNVFDGVVRPRREHEPELDADIEVASNRSMGVRLDYESRRTENSGVGGFTLAERGTSDARRDWSLQVSERRLGEAFVNDLRVRMRRRGSSAAPVSEGVAIDVADAFNRGGGTRRNLDEETRIQVEDRLRVPGSVSGGAGHHRRTAHVPVPARSRLPVPLQRQSAVQRDAATARRAAPVGVLSPAPRPPATHPQHQCAVSGHALGAGDPDAAARRPAGDRGPDAAVLPQRRQHLSDRIDGEVGGPTLPGPARAAPQSAGGGDRPVGEPELQLPLRRGRRRLQQPVPSGLGARPAGAQGAVAVPCPTPARCRTDAPVPEGPRPRHLRRDGLQLQSSRQLGPAVQHPQRT